MRWCKFNMLMANLRGDLLLSCLRLYWQTQCGLCKMLRINSYNTGMPSWQPAAAFGTQWWAHQGEGGLPDTGWGAGLGGGWPRHHQGGHAARMGGVAVEPGAPGPAHGKLLAGAGGFSPYSRGPQGVAGKGNQRTGDRHLLGYVAIRQLFFVLLMLILVCRLSLTAIP